MHQTASWMGDCFVVELSAVIQPTWPTQPSSLWGQLISSDPCHKGLRTQMAEDVVRGVAWRPSQ